MRGEAGPTPAEVILAAVTEPRRAASVAGKAGDARPEDPDAASVAGKAGDARPEDPGPFSPPQAPTGRGGGARILWAEIATIGIVAATAIALLLYFLLR